MAHNHADSGGWPVCMRSVDVTRTMTQAILAADHSTHQSLTEPNHKVQSPLCFEMEVRKWSLHGEVDENNIQFSGRTENHDRNHTIPWISVSSLAGDIDIDFASLNAQVKVHVRRLLPSTIWKSTNLFTRCVDPEIFCEDRPSLEKNLRSRTFHESDPKSICMSCHPALAAQLAALPPVAGLRYVVTPQLIRDSPQENRYLR